ncbi:RING finger protein [Rasamsonia emersonii CBS 393.64]|uniref:RING finger protein n=1 Tax=Rasamsonia emersonii (strain ATCC 16479 / CBS 393.64 / IMI 116815) TaxID=1408163 RepID=A0A0F4Z4W6_RASE3|nr:RING finger protein [Rasamsonia emersonii CBS 393.64]KKA25370.1 RING finger protein [Rasamsonia emersonii CBS 393.64]
MNNDEEMSGHPEDRSSAPPGQESDRNIYNLLTAPSTPSESSGFQPSTFGHHDMEASIPTTDHEHETRPLVDMRPSDTRAAPISRMVVRRQSTMSRLGSRILPNSVIRGLLNSEEETPAEGHAHRNGRLSRTLLRSETYSSRFNSLSSLGSRGISRRRSIRGPYPLPRGDAALIPDAPPNPTFLDSSAEPIPDSNRGSWRRSARLNRVRDSLATPISHIFGPPSPPPSSQVTSTPPQRPSRSTFHEGSDQLLPPLAPMDTTMDFDDPPHELDSVEPAVRSSRPLSPVPSTRTSQGPGAMRRLPGILRARPSRILRREEQTPLSRVLQLAAAAIAAQLSGTATPALPNIQSLGNDGLDASLENFIQSLQQATFAQTNALPSGDSQNQTADGNPAPVNFLRVFRFANPDTPSGASASGRTTPESGEQANRSDRMDVDEPAGQSSEGQGSEGRTVTLVVVGVRSVPSSGVVGNQHHTGGLGLDALLGLPLFPPSNTSQDQGGAGNLIRRADGGSRFSPHRNMMESTNANYDSQRHQRSSFSASRRPSDASSTPNGVSSTPATALSESPPGPHPPPSTPAEPILSAGSSGNSTPSRRPSSASAMSSSISPQLHEEPSRQPTVEPGEGDASSTGARQRRRSDSEYARHRHLGSGAARRNGVVEPDNPTPSTSRTWLIYVVGTNLSENHPAFAAPSLFTDNPTYEDMVLLSSLLGPAKPPVASQADVNSAGGVYTLVEYAGSLVAEAVDGNETIEIGENERCLICLSDYEAAEEVRQLAKCKHIYHKECIDQWLTTGRNSCPLCRGQGVAESSSNNTNTNSTAPAQEAAA